MGVMGPGARPRVLEGAFLGELARTWARLEGLKGVVSFPAGTLGSSDGCCWCYLLRHSKVRRERLPS